MPGLNNQSKPAFDRQHKVALLKKIILGDTITESELLDPEILGTYFIKSEADYFGGGNGETYRFTETQFAKIRQNAAFKGIELHIMSVGKGSINQWCKKYTKPFQAS
jgi:hypothetical protein